MTRTHSKYYYEKGEANFGRPLRTEVEGGAHLTFEVILRRESKLVALRRPSGIHGEYAGALFFVHGLIRFGESVDKCVRRLVRDQAGVKVKSHTSYGLDSWVDNHAHWHLALNLIAEIADKPVPSPDISEVIEFSANAIPKGMAWWSKRDLVELFESPLFEASRRAG